MKFSMSILCVLNAIHIIEVECDHQKISKRSLYFPTTTVLQFTYGLSIPLTIDTPEDTTILLSTCLQGNYDLPKKASDLEVHSLRKRHATSYFDPNKIEIYNNIIDYLNSLDLDGAACLAKMICENAKYPLDIEGHDNVLERILHFVLSPEQKHSELMDEEEKYLHNELLMAAEFGKKNGSCELRHRNCMLSLTSLFSLFFDE